MSDLIAAATSSIVDRLTAGLAALGGAPPPVARQHDLVPPIPADPPTLTVFLYDVVQDPTVRNRPPTTHLVAGQHVTIRQPLGLVLHYMLTPWGGDRNTELEMLGRAMQVLYDDAIIDGPDLRGSLAGSPAQLKVSLEPLYLEDRARIWFAIGQPYHLSINYEVRVVNIDALTERTTGVVRDRELVTGVPAVR